jgi:hypothetical protein
MEQPLDDDDYERRNSLKTPTSKREIDEIERQWAEFRRRNAKATERVAAQEYHDQLRPEEEKRLEKAYLDLMTDSEIDRRQRIQHSVKAAAALMSGKKVGGVSGVNSFPKANQISQQQNPSFPTITTTTPPATKKAPSEERIPQAFLLGASQHQDDDEITTNLSYKSQQQQQQISRRGSQSTTTNNIAPVPRSPVTPFPNNNALGASATSLSQIQNQKRSPTPSSANAAVVVSENNNNFNNNNFNNNKPEAKTITIGGNVISMRDPDMRKAVRLIERKVRAFLLAKLQAQRQVEMQRAAADARTDEGLSLWRAEVWEASQMMRPRYQLPNSMVAALEMQRRAAENELIRRQNSDDYSRQQQYHRSPYAVAKSNQQQQNAARNDGSNLNWIHDHLLRSADRFEKRKNLPALTKMDVASEKTARSSTPTLNSRRRIMF